MADSLASMPEIRFQCTQCSRCCRHDPGVVFLSRRDFEQLRRYLQLSAHEFTARYCRWIAVGAVEQLSLAEQSNFDCIFWRDGGCTVYEARPVQCRTYPLWAHILDTPADWHEEAGQCPGIGIGPVVSLSAIRDALSSRERNIPMVRPRHG